MKSASRVCFCTSTVVPTNRRVTLNRRTVFVQAPGGLGTDRDMCKRPPYSARHGEGSGLSCCTFILGRISFPARGFDEYLSDTWYVEGCARSPKHIKSSINGLPSAWQFQLVCFRFTRLFGRFIRGRCSVTICAFFESQSPSKRTHFPFDPPSCYTALRRWRNRSANMVFAHGACAWSNGRQRARASRVSGQPAG